MLLFPRGWLGILNAMPAAFGWSIASLERDSAVRPPSMPEHPRTGAGTGRPGLRPPEAAIRPTVEDSLARRSHGGYVRCVGEVAEWSKALAC